MKIPDQILNTLKGTDVTVVPPPQPGKQNTPGEMYAMQHIEHLIGLGMSLAHDAQGTSLLFNPAHYDSKKIHAYALAGRLQEVASGHGNNHKGEDAVSPMAMLHVKSAANQEHIRSIPVSSPEQVQSALAANATPDNTVDIGPATISPHKLVGAKIGGEVKSQAQGTQGIENIKAPEGGQITANLPGADNNVQPMSVVTKGKKSK
jgi:hypothetical protein